MRLSIVTSFRTSSLISLGPLADTVKVSRGRVRVTSAGGGGGASLTTAGVVLIVPFLRRAGFHGDIDVTRVAGRYGRVIGVVRSVRGARVAAEVALQPLGRLEFSRLVLLLEVQRLLRQRVLPCRGRVPVRETCNNSFAESVFPLVARNRDRQESYIVLRLSILQNVKISTPRS